MKNDWTFRWWDMIALAAVLAAAVLAIQYGLARSLPEAPLPGADRAASVRVRVSLQRPAPEVADLIQVGDEIFDSGGRTIGRLTGKKSVGRNWEVTLEIAGELLLFRNLPGQAKAPLVLRPGIWCLVTSFEYELPGQVLGVERLAGN